MTKLPTKFALSLVTVIVIGLFAGIRVKADPPDPLPGIRSGRTGKFIKISGQVGSMSELYSVSGRDRRRPGSTGRLFLKPTLSIYNTLNISLNLFLSTEGNGARQNINQIDLNPKWGWGEAHLVDFTDNYSQFTLNGIKIRGAGLKLNPGLFRMSVISGTSRRETNGPGGTDSYRRQVNGGKIGIGRDGGSFLDLIVLSTKDSFSGTDSIIADTATYQDSTGFDSAQNPASVTPQANLVGALVSNLSLANKRMTWKNELAGSAFTRDRRSPEWEQKNYPSSLKGIFTPRLSTSVDYAYSTDVSLNISNYGFQGGYQYIGPGYVSLGLSSQSSDRQVIKLGLNRRLKAGAVKLNFSRQNDNLIGQKSFTTNRYNVSVGGVYNPLRIWNVNLNLAFISMNNDAPDSAARVDFRNWMFQTGNSFTFDRDLGLKNISFDYSYQTSGDSDPSKYATSLKSHTILLRGAYFPYANVGVLPSANFVETRQADAGWKLTQTYTLGFNISSFEKKLISNVQTGITTNGGSSSFRIGLRSNYKLTGTAVLGGQVDFNSVSARQSGGNFSEITARLNATQRF